MALGNAAAMRARAPATAVLGSAALAGLLSAGVVLAAGAAAQRRLFFVPASEAGRFPEWLAGPLHELEVVILPQRGAQLLVVMALCYLVALACVRALPAWVAVAAIVAALAADLLALATICGDVIGFVD